MTDSVQVNDTPFGLLVTPGVTTTDGIVLYAPGGRDLAARPEAALNYSTRLAALTGTRVLCARYQPAFPGVLVDIENAYRYCAELGTVALAGVRLGAGLVAALMLRLRDNGEAMPAGAVLVAGLLDLTLEASSIYLNAASDPGFDGAHLRDLVRTYAAGTPVDAPMLSPLYGNLHGLPPTRLIVAGNDPLVDDSLAFAAKAARSGVVVDLLVRADPAGLRSDLVPEMAAFLAARIQAGAFGVPVSH